MNRSKHIKRSIFCGLSRTIKNQKGSVVPLLAASLVAMLGMTGMVVDSGHVFVAKTRLQNAIDATALSAAKTLDETGNQNLSRFVARKLFNENLELDGFTELRDLGLDATDLTIQFSNTRNPFISNPAATRYARVRLNRGQLELQTIFMNLLGVEKIDLAVSAVAGPSPALGETCNIVPTVVCGDPDIPPDNDGMFGYQYGDKVSLAMGSVTNNNIGPGNFQLLDIEGNDKTDKLRENLAGGSKGCVSDQNTVSTKPGVNRGSVAQGINTRFGFYSGPTSYADYPPDKVTDAGSPGFPDSYAEYKLDYKLSNYDESTNGIPERRVIAVSFGRCEGTVNGQGDISLLGFGCIFLNEPSSQTGALQDVQIYGELIRECNAQGIPGPNPVDGPGLHTIILYGDPNAWAS